MHITADDIKLIHDLGWALMPYAIIIWLGVTIFTIKIAKAELEKEKIG
jgi:hypothetical protein